MLSAIERQILYAKLVEYEGNIPHMYLDTKGYVTVGIGHLLSTVTAAQKLPFMDEKTKKKATAEEIKADFETILKLPRDPKKPPVAAFYKKHTKLVLTHSDIDAHAESHLNSFHGELKRLYSSFNSYPREVRLALFDMIFNLGMTGLRKYTDLNKAIKIQDWQKAAKESRRLLPGRGGAERNSYVRKLFEKAAKNA